MNELRLLPELIQELRVEFQKQRQQYNDRSQAVESEIKRIGNEIRRLETDQKKANQELYHLRRKKHSLDEKLREALLQQVVTHQQTGRQQLEAAIGQSLDVQEELQHQQHALLAADPALEKDLEDYRQFETSRKKAMQSAPAYYRSVLAEAHEKMRQRLQPLLEIEAQLAQLPTRLEVSLPLLLAVDDEQEQLFMALPLLAGDENQQNTGNRRMDAIENAVLQTSTMLASHPDWTILDIERSQWAGFRVLTTLFNYSGSTSIEQSCQETLFTHLPECWPFQGIDPILQITRLDWDLWQIGQERTGLLLVMTESEPELITEFTEHARISDLFTERDLTSWERPMRVVEESAWTVQGRRLRTLLMRLVAQGRIGKDGLTMDQLTTHLPQKHADALLAVLPELIQTGILVESQSSQNNKTVSINPELLLDVQDLINREISVIWETLVED